MEIISATHIDFLIGMGITWAEDQVIMETFHQSHLDCAMETSPPSSNTLLTLFE